MGKKKEEYNASSIQSLSQHNHLLKRLSLTFGRETGHPDSPFSSQKSVAIREIIDNAVDEVLGGYGNRIRVTYHKDGSFEVQDNGRGLPVDVGADSTGKAASGVYLCLGVIQSGGKFTADSKRYSSGLNGVGSSSTIHTSKRADVTVYRENKVYKLSFKDGTPGFFGAESDPEAPFAELEDYRYLKVEEDTRSKEEKAAFPTGTIVRTWLRDSVYSSKYPVDTLDLTERLRGTAYLVPELTIEVRDELNLIKDPASESLMVREDIFNFTGGIPDLVDANMTSNPLSEIVSITTETSYVEQGVPVLENGTITNKDITRFMPIDVAFAWEAGYDYKIESYVNTIRTRLGGVHEVAFEKALVSAFSDRFSSMRGMMKKDDPKLIIDDFKEGLVAVVYARIPEPQFSGQSKEELSGREVQRAMTSKLTEVLTEFANAPKNQDLMKSIGEKVIQAARNRKALKDQLEIKRKQNAIENSSSMPEKLDDCELVGDENSELYIVEGDSACGALSGGRIAKYQALIPLKGKLINADRQTLKKLLENKEIQSLITVIGAGFGADFDVDKARYGRIFIATDADVDGGNISALILSFLYRYMRPLIEEGRVYKVVTPLHNVIVHPGTKKEESIFAYNDTQHREILNDLQKRKIKYDSRRLKGLGEGGQQVIIDTAMNPATRLVQKITIPDEARAEAMFKTVFGEDTQVRKDWISANPMDEFTNLE